MPPEFYDALSNIVTTLAIPVFLGIAGLILMELKKHGYRTAFADALVRAAGIAQLAATNAGTTLFTPEGRKIGAAAGARYMMENLPDAAKALDIDATGAFDRVSAQIGTMIVQPPGQAVSPAPLVRENA